MVQHTYIYIQNKTGFPVFLKIFTIKVLDAIMVSCGERVNKGTINKIRTYLIKFFKYLISNRNILYMFIPFILMDLSTRFLGRSINFYGLFRLVPNAFTFLWAFLFIGFSMSFKSKYGKWIYLLINIVFLVFFLVNNVYYSMTSTFFNFSLLESASEGTPYILDTILNCNKLVYLFALIIIVVLVIVFKHYPKQEKSNYKNIIKVLLIFVVLHSITPIFLGKANSELVWSTWKNPRNVYNQFNDSNKSMRVSGLLEYTLRGLYVTYLKVEEKNDDDILFLEEEYSKESSKSDNKYTSMFNGKNLIFIQLEGIDSWLFNKEDTPTLYGMLNNSINFTNHYSFYTGGGSTFNSEFAVNTGFIVPFSFNQNAYAFNKNYFPNSMANIFKNAGYTVNAFHMNSGEYYSRTINYNNWGYDAYNGLIDMYKYTDNKYMLDRELIENEEYSNLMFNEETPFVDYIITYSTHMPFNNTKGVCKQLYNIDNTLTEEESSILEENSTSSEETPFVQMNEEQCARRQANETDYMISLLLDKLREKNLLDNTVIVVFSDHYLYTLEDKTLLDIYKTTSNNLINNTPFFIYNSSLKKSQVNKVTSQLNILPTVLNLFGMDYNSNYYIGKDALDNNYSSLVFFSDYSWYDGNVYVEDGEVTNNKSISNENLEDKNTLVNYLAKKNDLTLKYNYFKKLK